MADLTAADPVAVALGWLRGRPAITAAFGSAEHISGLVEAPWPHLRVSAGPGGSVDDVLWQNTGEIVLEVIDHPSHVLGEAALWRLAMTALIELSQLPNREVSPTEPVVTLVRANGTVSNQPLQTGQGRQLIGVSVTVHPPHA